MYDYGRVQATKQETAYTKSGVRRVPNQRYYLIQDQQQYQPQLHVTVLLLFLFQLVLPNLQKKDVGKSLDTCPLLRVGTLLYYY